jgi:hypothetical protein
MSHSIIIIIIIIAIIIGVFCVGLFLPPIVVRRRIVVKRRKPTLITPKSEKNGETTDNSQNTADKGTIDNNQQTDTFGLKDELAAENNMSATFFQAVTALALIVGAGFTVYQIIDTAKTTRSQLDLTKEQVSLAKQSQISRQFTQAVSQLAPTSDEATRLGGVYGLAKVEEESPGYRADVTNVLAQFVRDAAGQVKSRDASASLNLRKPSVQAALSVLFSASPKQQQSVYVELSAGLSRHLDLRLSYFRYDNLELVNLEGDALDGAEFQGAYLNGACLYSVSVNNANFQGATLYGTNLSHIENLSYAKWSKRTKYDQYTRWPKARKNTKLYKEIKEVKNALTRKNSGKRPPKEASCPQ